MSEITPEPKLEIRILPVTPLQQNCSLIWDSVSKRAAFVDPGGDIDTLMGALDHFGLTLTRIWLTHGHFDHAGAAAELSERTGVKVEGPHKDDQFWLDQIESGAERYGMSGFRNVTPDRYFEDGETLEFEGATFDIAHTPGHTPGHVVIHNAALKIAFVGDVLFQGSIGRTDFPRGDHAQLLRSITEKLWPLGEDITFVPGHGPTSTFGQERRSNAFVADRLTGYAGAEKQAPNPADQRISKRYSSAGRMKPRELIATAKISGGDELRLFRRGDDHMIMLGGNELMSSRVRGSEEALAVMTCERLHDRAPPHLLIGGYGMGFTLRAALASLGPAARVTVAELVPEIIDWARGPMAALTAGCLDDPRVQLVTGDVATAIGAAERRYDAVLLDVDNGPDGLTRAANDQFYAMPGLAAAKAALKPNGILAIWSAAPDAAFARRLKQAGFQVEEASVRARSNGKGARHVIWFAR